MDFPVQLVQGLTIDETVFYSYVSK